MSKEQSFVVKKDCIPVTRFRRHEFHGNDIKCENDSGKAKIKSAYLLHKIERAIQFNFTSLLSAREGIITGNLVPTNVCPTW